MIKCPDRWVVLTIKSEEFGTVEKLFFGYYGGYGGSDTWGMNSGITKVEKDAKGYRFHGDSGSIYNCYYSNYGMSGYMASIYREFEASISKVPGSSMVINKDYEYGEV